VCNQGSVRGGCKGTLWEPEWEEATGSGSDGWFHACREPKRQGGRFLGFLFGVEIEMR